MKKVQIALVFIFGFLWSYTQEKHANESSEEVAGVTMSFSEFQQWAYGDLYPHLPTNVLIDQVPKFDSEKENFDSQYTDIMSDYANFLLAFAQLRSGSIHEKPELSLFEIDSIGEQSLNEEGIIELGLIDFKYSKISQSAFDNGYVQLDNDRLIWNGYDASGVFEVGNVFLLSPIAEFHAEGPITVRLREELIFSDNTNEWLDLYVSVGDTNNFQLLVPGQQLDLDLNLGIQKKLYTKAVYSTGPVKYSCAALSTDDTDVEQVSTNHNTVGSAARGSKMTFIKDGDYNEIVPDRIERQTVNVPISNPDNGINPDAHVTLGIYYGCGNTSGKILKPYIVSSGFSPFSPFGRRHIGPNASVNGNSLTIKKGSTHFESMNGILGQDGADQKGGAAEHYDNNGANLLFKLRNEGFDIVIIHFDNGVDYLENNAAVIRQVINYVNAEKFAEGSKHENVFQGNSMGALAGRIALRRMEIAHKADPINNPHHHTRAFVSFEGEMQGATIPLGIQHVIAFLTKQVSGAMALGLLANHNLKPKIALQYIDDLTFYRKQLLDNPVARAMLIHHYSANDKANDTKVKSHPYFDQLMTTLDHLGYPDMRLIALADGSNYDEKPVTTGYGQCILDMVGVFPLISGAHNLFYRINVNLEKPGLDKVVFEGTVGVSSAVAIFIHKKIIKKNYDIPTSFIPGAYERFYKHIFYAFLKNLPGTSCLSSEYRAPFVPTVSVFDINPKYQTGYMEYDAVSNLFYNKPGIFTSKGEFGYPHNSPSINIPNVISSKEITPFDALFATKQNERHLDNPPQELANFLLSEITPKDLIIQNRTISATKGKYAHFESRNSIRVVTDESTRTPEGQFILENGTDVLLGAGNHITFRPGFMTSPKSKLEAIISTMADTCFGFNRTKRAKRDISVNIPNSEETSNVHLQASLDKSVRDARIEIFPNPSSDKVTIELSYNNVGMKSCQLLNSQGVLVLSLNSGIKTIDVSNLPRGAYTLSIHFDDGLRSTKRIIKL